MRRSIVIVGAGPTGLSLALGLARNGVESVVLERKTALDPHSRATVILPRTIEILDQLGVADRFLEEGNRVPHIRLRNAPDGQQLTHFDFTDLTGETAHPYAIALAQDRTERILLDAVQATGLVDVRFGVEVASLSIGDDGIDVTAHQAGAHTSLAADFIVGADGAHSIVRHAMGIDLAGKTYPSRALLADIEVPAAREQADFWPTLLREAGLVVGIRFGPRIFRIVADAIDDRVDESNMDAEVDRLSRLLFAAPPTRVVWRAIYQKHQRCVPTFRRGRAMLAGDAAHLNSPAGGQGMNSSIQDAHNLAWKLGRIVTEDDADVDALLDSYAGERRGYVIEQIQPFTDRAEWFETAPSWLRALLVTVGGRITGADRTAPAMARRLSMLDTRYSRSVLLVGDDRAVGKRLPDVLGPNGKRLLAGNRDAVILHSQREAAAAALGEALSLPVIDGDLAMLAEFFGGDRYIALIRPDGIVGWATATGAPSIAACRHALGGIGMK
ncbi:MAG: FAD-dependent monooxygenase [Sphingomonas sp.]|uniref:FAD-dependent oxidoreductase n=1 Tax=Sphingomonas sp. TaxID=28214 RepID=UPI00262B3AEA|nr:FAD-dependent monooxygenase [Sphingomonas sp.]MDK2768110.1 FAD-dependent monooxygenase [Sphingomonas sp.]